MREPTRSLSKLACVALIVLSFNATARAQDNPPRIEIGALLSSAKQPPFLSDDYHVGGGGRFTVNVTRYIAGEAELTRQPTGNPYYGHEWHTALAVGTYRAEARRWLKFAGINFFGVLGPAWVNRSVDVANPNPPPFCFRCTVQRHTTSMMDFGGGVEIVPARAIAVRFDVTHASFSEIPAFSSFTAEESRTYVKAAVMVRLP